MEIRTNGGWGVGWWILWSCCTFQILSAKAFAGAVELVDETKQAGTAQLDSAALGDAKMGRRLRTDVRSRSGPKRKGFGSRPDPEGVGSVRDVCRDSSVSGSCGVSGRTKDAAVRPSAVCLDGCNGAQARQHSLKQSNTSSLVTCDHL